MQKFLSILLLVTITVYAQAMEKSIPQPDDWQAPVRGGVTRFIPQGSTASEHARSACAEERRRIEEDHMIAAMPNWVLEQALREFDKKCETEFAVASVIDQMTKAMNEGLAAGGSKADYQAALAKVGVKPEDVKIGDSDSQNPKE